MNQKDESIELFPDSFIPGKFNVESGYFHEDKSKFLGHCNWVYHDSVAEPIKKGEYHKIKPYSAELVPTMNCTHRCVFPCSFEDQKKLLGCWEKNDFKNPKTHMQDLGYAKNLVDKLHDGGIKGIIITGGGDPFLYGKLGELMKYINKKGIDEVLYTNGVAISDNQLEKVMESEPLMIRVSLNATTKNVYNQLHNPLNKKNSHEKALNNIEKLVERTKYYPNTEVGIAFVVDEINKDDLVESAKKLANIVKKTKGKISSVSIRPRYHYRGGKQLGKDFLEEAFEHVEKNVKPIFEEAGIKCNNVKPRYESLINQEKKFEICRVSGMYAEVAPDGGNYFCCDNNAHEDWKTGDLNEQTLNEIFESEEYKKIRDRVNQDNCNGCPPGCKPHLTNVQAEIIEAKRALGEMDEVLLWMDAIRKIPPSRMINF